jgi:hypothetical protein
LFNLIAIWLICRRGVRTVDLHDERGNRRTHSGSSKQTTSRGTFVASHFDSTYTSIPSFCLDLDTRFFCKVFMYRPIYKSNRNPAFAGIIIFANWFEELTSSILGLSRTKVQVQGLKQPWWTFLALWLQLKIFIDEVLEWRRVLNRIFTYEFENFEFTLRYLMYLYYYIAFFNKLVDVHPLC